jgi:hypothetical protein
MVPGDTSPGSKGDSPVSDGSRRSEGQSQDEEEPEEHHEEGNQLDIVGARGSLLHAVTPDPTGPLPVVGR